MTVAFSPIMPLLQSITIILLLCAGNLYGQVSHHATSDLLLPEGHEQVSVWRLGDKGLLIRSRNTFMKGKTEEWHYQVLDTEFHPVRSITVSSPSKMPVVQTSRNGDYFHTLRADKKGRFLLTTIMLSSMEVTKVPIRLSKRAEVTAMLNKGNHVYISNQGNKAHEFSIVNWRTGAIRTHALDRYQEKSRPVFITEMWLSSERGFASINIKVRQAKGTNDTRHRLVFDTLGTPVDSLDLTSAITNKLRSVNTVCANGGKSSVYGTYCEGTNALPIGIYRLDFEDTIMVNAQWTQFSHIPDFIKIEQEINNRHLISQKHLVDKPDVIYDLKCHALIPLVDGGQLLVGELYYPVYKAVGYGDRSYTRFLGNQYTHTVLVKYDSRGIPVGASSFETWSDYRPYSAKRFILVNQLADGNTALICTHQKKVQKRIIDANATTVSMVELEPIEIATKHSKGLSLYAVVKEWYEDYFLAYDIKSVERDKKVRMAVFMTKVKF